MTAKKYANLTKSEAISIAWKKRKDYKGYDSGKGSKFNSWRALVYSKKGARVGSPSEWKKYDIFDKDTLVGWEKGKILCRKNTSMPYSKDNCEWREKGEENLSKLAKITYNGETKTLVEWCACLGINYQGARQRYFKGKNYTVEQILFGKRKRLATVISDINELNNEQEKKNKVSKMLSQYRLKDKKKGLVCDIDNQWLQDVIANGKCVYCGDTKRLGLDRIDNSKGHTKDNVVVCCYDCNVARGNNFSYEEMMVLGKTIKQIKAKRHENRQK